MFDFVRKHTRVMQLVLFLLIVPSFVLFGLEGYSRFNEQGETVARVDGRDVSQTDWDAAHRREVERMQQQVPGLNAAMLDTPQAKYATLERLVRDRVLAAAAQKAHLGVTDQRLARELQGNEVIASLRGPDGRLDMARYRQLLASQGLTPEGFEAQMRSDLSMRQVLAGVAATAVAPPAVANVSLGAYYERREVQVQRFAAADYTSKVTVTDADIEAYYKSNPQEFQAPEQVDIEYLVLDLDAISKDIAVNEQELRGYFEQNVGRLSGQEERRASHILVAAAKDAPAADRAKAKAKAEELLAQLRRNPASFAEVARKNSQDPASAANGGDLDFFARGAMTKPFEDAAFALKKGELSGVVETEFGYHIIQVTDLKVPRQRTFEEVRPTLEADFRKQAAQKKYAESAEAFSNGVYEQSDTLKPVADKLKLPVRTATGVTRFAKPGTSGVLANPKFLQALFTPDALEKKRNTEAIETASSQLASGRVVKHTPARTRPLDEVKAQVRERLVAERAVALARQDGQARLAAWKAAPATASLPAPTALSRDEGGRFPREVVEGALRADATTLPAWVGVDLGDGYAVVKVLKTVPRTTPVPADVKQELEQYATAWSSAETLAYYEMLKERFKVQIKAPRPAPAAVSVQ